jgi:two-component system sensor histidine kinase YesM
MNLKDKTVTLGQELDHISNYLEMQKIRFPNSVDFFILCPDYLRNRDIPYLLMFTLVENTIKHAMDLYSTLELLIQCEEYETENFKGIRLVVEDNGPGFTKEVMETYLDPNRIPKLKEHIGLSNVIRTLQLTYHRSDLLRLSNSITGGAHVELLIPDEETEEQVSPEGENHSREGGKTA